jgi:hypothetical protein
MRMFVFLLLLVAVFIGLDVDMALAQDKELYCDTKGLLEGSVGNIIGTLVALSGLFTFLRGSMFGIILIIIGAAVLIFPQMFSSFLTGMDMAFSGTKAGGRGTGGSYDVACP